MLTPDGSKVNKLQFKKSWIIYEKITHLLINPGNVYHITRFL